MIKAEKNKQEMINGLTNTNLHIVISKVISKYFICISLVGVIVLLSACGNDATKSNNEFVFAMGNSDVPVGGYTQKVLEHYGINENEVNSHISYGSNVKEVTTAIAEGMADCGVVYATDAYSANLKIVDYATEEMCGRVLYPAAILKNSSNRQAAEHFLEYLKTSTSQDIFSNVGFTNLLDCKEVEDYSSDSGEIEIFAAVSMTETLTEIAKEYANIAPNVKIIFNFDSSGTLKTQIEEGAECDIFISASPKQMNSLDIACDDEINPDRLDYIDSTTRINLLENKVVLCVSTYSKYEIDNFESLVNILNDLSREN